jgi:hypothetical protein
MERRYFTTKSIDRLLKVAHPSFVTFTVWPKHMAVFSLEFMRIMWRKKTMLDSAGTGLP